MPSQNQNIYPEHTEAPASKDLPAGIVPMLSAQQFAEVIGFSYRGLMRLVREGRLPEGTLVRIGNELRFNPEKVQAVIRGELRILTASEGNALGFFHSRQVRADHEKRVAKQVAKTSRAQTQSLTNSSN